ncbi:DUF2721 domain-containing protein [Aliiglaciecola litoralis]|uniref:DUF2721 domain-containing protein n=1 Tax=Aliiglaciecola litoralis TaxID=582857 RepID=A0ABN1LQ46_9ALTE
MEVLIGESAVELIQLALAPVFLIVGIGQMVNVATGRLARVIDRARSFEEGECSEVYQASAKATLEIKSLRRRMRFANWAVTFLIGAAVTVCIDVILLLVNGLIMPNLNIAIITTFILGLLLTTGGLIAFFLEVSVATATLRIGPDKL